MKVIEEQHEKSLHELDDKAMQSYKDTRRVIDTIPFVTIEPKFNNNDNEFDKNIKALVDVLIDSPLSNVAVIATTTTIEKILQKIIPEISGIRIAKAYRSIPVKYGHIWRNNLNSNKKNKDRIIHMPDKSLITEDIKRKKTDDHTDINNNELVISWLIDDEEEMWDLFDKGTDAIISNKPIELLNLLKENYQQRC